MSVVLPFSISLDDVKAFLGYNENDETRDAALTILVKTGVATLRTMLGRNLDLGLYRDTFHYDGCFQKFYVREAPVIEVSSVKVGDTELSASDYQIFKSDGLVYLRTVRPSIIIKTTGIWTEQFLKVEYTAGYATLPDDIYGALLTGIQMIDSVQRLQITHGGVVQSVTVQDVGTVTYGANLSKNVTTIFRDAVSGLLEDVLTDVAIGTPNLHTSEYLSGSPA